METNSIDIQLSPRETVVRTIGKWINKGVLPADSAMPSEDELARQLNVSRGTVRTGLDLLEKRGLLYKQNRRRYVSEQHDRSYKASPLHQTVLLLGVNSDNPIEFKDTGFLQAVQAGALDALSSTGAHALSLHADKLNRESLKNLLEMKPRGAVLFQDFLKTPEGVETAYCISSSGIPVVIDHESSELDKFDRVCFDHVSANYNLTKYFIDRGLKNILCLYPKDGWFWLKAKYNGYLKAVNEAGLQPMPPVNTSEKPEYQRTRENFDEYVRLYAGFMVEHFTGKRQPQVILASSDWDVPVIASACRLFGKEPGKDIMIGGYDNKVATNPWYEFDQTPPCVTVEKNNTGIGRKMIQLLDRRINGELPDIPVKIEVSGKLIILQ